MMKYENPEFEEKRPGNDEKVIQNPLVPAPPG